MDEGEDVFDGSTVGASARRLLERLVSGGPDPRLVGATAADRWATARADAQALAAELRQGDELAYRLVERVGESTWSELRAIVELEDLGGSCACWRVRAVPS